MKESHYQTLVVFSFFPSREREFTWLNAKFFTLQSSQGMSRIVLRSHAAMIFIRPLRKNRESVEFMNQSLNFRGFNDDLV